MQTYAKPFAARGVEARARARQFRVRVLVEVAARKYVTASQTRPGTVHTIERTPAGWACSCEGFEYTGMCKHLGQVERRAEREGWPFGRIASLAAVGRYMPLGEPDQAPAPESTPAVPTVTIAEHRARKAAALADLYGDVA